MVPDYEQTVVVVDDDEFMRHYLTETITSGGYGCKSFQSGLDALGWLASGGKRVDILLSDINMPGMSGLDLLRTVKAVVPDLPFVLVSGQCDLPMAQGALRAGATDYLLKPVRPADLLQLVSRHIGASPTENFEVVKKLLRDTLGGSAQTRYAKDVSELKAIFDAMGFKRFETLQHSRRVAAYCLLIARKVGFEPSALAALELGGLLHDIGKAGIPHNVLMKPGKLTDAEWAIMKLHPQLGLDLISGVPGLELESQVVFSHHERFDGSGYPQKLAGEAIPLAARIFSIADTLDALTSNRCYRDRCGLAAARAEIRRAAGSQLDPALSAEFESVEDREIEAIREEFPDIE